MNYVLTFSNFLEHFNLIQYGPAVAFVMFIKKRTICKSSPKAKLLNVNCSQRNNKSSATSKGFIQLYLVYVSHIQSKTIRYMGCDMIQGGDDSCL